MLVFVTPQFSLVSGGLLRSLADNSLIIEQEHSSLSLTIAQRIIDYHACLFTLHIFMKINSPESVLFVLFEYYELLELLS